jgi:hypothetical protein
MHLYCRDDLHKAGWSFAHGRLTSDEARRIAAGIASAGAPQASRRLLSARRRPQVEGGKALPCGARGLLHPQALGRDRPDLPLEEFRWARPASAFIGTACGCVHEFADQLQAMMFWNEFAGRWLRYGDFVLPERRDDIPRMKRIKDFDKYQVRSSGWR